MKWSRVRVAGDSEKVGRVRVGSHDSKELPHQTYAGVLCLTIVVMLVYGCERRESGNGRSRQRWAFVMFDGCWCCFVERGVGRHSQIDRPVDHWRRRET